MNSRIKELRKHLGLTQAEFGESIGLKQTSVAGYETGARTPSDAIVLSICKEYNVNEYWLRTGDGEMFRKKSRGEEIMEYAAKVAGGELDEFQTALFSTMAKLSAEQMALLADIAKTMVEEYKKEKAGQ